MGERLRRALSRKVNGHLSPLAFACVAAMSACSPLGLSANEAGICQTTDGNTVDTYQLVGKWKKISPYTPARTDAELGVNYELMIIEGGVQLNTVRAPMCLANVVNGGLSTVPYRALYEHNLTKKMIYVEYTEGEGDGTTADIKYSFSGSCADTKLTLNYGSTTEVYKIYGTSDTVNSGDCTGGSQ